MMNVVRNVLEGMVASLAVTALVTYAIVAVALMVMAVAMMFVAVTWPFWAIGAWLVAKLCL